MQVPTWKSQKRRVGPLKSHPPRAQPRLPTLRTSAEEEATPPVPGSHWKVFFSPFLKKANSSAPRNLAAFYNGFWSISLETVKKKRETLWDWNIWRSWPTTLTSYLSSNSNMLTLESRLRIPGHHSTFGWEVALATVARRRNSEEEPSRSASTIHTQPACSTLLFFVI